MHGNCEEEIISAFENKFTEDHLGLKSNTLHSLFFPRIMSSFLFSITLLFVSPWRKRNDLPEPSSEPLRSGFHIFRRKAFIDKTNETRLRYNYFELLQFMIQKPHVPWKFFEMRICAIGFGYTDSVCGIHKQRRKATNLYLSRPFG